MVSRIAIKFQWYLFEKLDYGQKPKLECLYDFTQTYFIKNPNKTKTNSTGGADGQNRTVVGGLQNHCFTTKLHRQMFFRTLPKIEAMMATWIKHGK